MMMRKSYLPQNIQSNSVSLLLAVLIVVTMLLVPSSSTIAFAQGVHPACKKDSGAAVVPSGAAGVGAWMLVLNFNHSASATSTTGCLIKTTSLNPQKVSRTLVNCQIINNGAGTQVGSGNAPFDGKFSIFCPGVASGKRELENFTIWGRASFGSNNASYSIVQHPDVSFTGNLSVDWRASFDSRYSNNNFASGNPTFNLLGQTVSFTSATLNGMGSHSLNEVALGTSTAISNFEFHYDQPITIGAAGQVWTLHELIIDPPGGCCKAG